MRCAITLCTAFYRQGAVFRVAVCSQSPQPRQLRNSPPRQPRLFSDKLGKGSVSGNETQYLWRFPNYLENGIAFGKLNFYGASF